MANTYKPSQFTSIYVYGIVHGSRRNSGPRNRHHTQSTAPPGAPPHRLWPYRAYLSGLAVPHARTPPSHQPPLVLIPRSWRSDHTGSALKAATLKGQKRGGEIRQYLPIHPMLATGRPEDQYSYPPLLGLTHALPPARVWRHSKQRLDAA